MEKDYTNLQEGIARDIAKTIWALSYDEKQDKLTNISFTAEELTSHVNDHVGGFKNYTVQQIRSGLITLGRSPKYQGQIHQIRRDGKVVVYGNYIPASGCLSPKQDKASVSRGGIAVIFQKLEAKADAFDQIAQIVNSIKK